MVAENTNVTALFRSDDGAVLISTDAYVSHKKRSGPWRSTFSMSIRDAAKLRDEISAILAAECAEEKIDG